MVFNKSFALLCAAFSFAACGNGQTTSTQESVATDTLQTQLSQQVETRQKPQGTLTCAMVGDMMLGTTYNTVQLPQADGAELFHDCGDILRDATVTVGNLEGPMSEKGTSTKSGPHSFAFRMPTRYVNHLVKAGFDFVCIANNHVNDMGEVGKASTIATLDSAGIAWAGIKDEHAYVIREINGWKIGFCAFGQNSYCYLHREEDTVQKILKELRPQCDILICSFHGGAEGSSMNHVPQGTETFLGENRGNLRHFTHLAIDCGADIVHGHGPHVPRGVELYKNHLICYSLGNFCTPYGMSLGANLGYAPIVVAEMASDGTFLKGQIHGFIQQRGIGPRKDKTGAVVKEIKSLSEADFPNSPLSIDANGAISVEK